MPVYGSFQEGTCMKNPGSAVRAWLMASAVAVAVASSASAAELKASIVPAVVAQHGVVQMGEVAPSAHLRLQVVLPMRNLADLRSLLDTGVWRLRTVPILLGRTDRW
jgi:hypothetical protein